MRTQKTNKLMINGLISLLSVSVVTSCQKSNDSFSLLAEQSTFKQSTAIVPRKIDILWVVDNSGSMATSQQNIANNFHSFIRSFQTKNYDFQIGVTTTDAYLAYHYNDNNRSKLRDGVGSTHSGFPIVTKTTPNLENVFITNILQGIAGSGDERAFMSFQHTLQNPLNAGFKRNGSFLSIIIISDEEDFSHYDYANGISSYTFSENYNDPSMYPVQNYINFLDQYTNSKPSQRNYSVNAIYVMDNACLTQLGAGRKISTRYPSLVDATGGVKASICSDFGASLQMISDTVLDLASVFQLDRTPVESSIVVTVNDTSIPKDATNGWTYQAADNTISFHGTAIPSADANIQITFDPVTVKQ